MQSVQEQLLIYRLEMKQDAEAFGELYSIYREPIQRFLRFRVSSNEVADDLTADVFLKLWQHVKEGRRITHFRGLIYQIARHAVIDYYRSAKVMLSIDEVPEHALGLLESDLPYHGPIEKEKLLTALKDMRPEYRELLTLFYFEELRVKEIAMVMHKRPGAVRVQLHRAIKAIRYAVQRTTN